VKVGVRDSAVVMWENGGPACRSAAELDQRYNVDTACKQAAAMFLTARLYLL
jgi:hypothetical protein